MGGLAGVAAHLDGAVQLIGQALLIRRNGDGDALTGGVAAEVIHAVVAAGIGLEGVAVAVGVVQGEVVVIHTRHLLLGAHHPVNCSCTVSPGLTSAFSGSSLPSASNSL